MLDRLRGRLGGAGLVVAIVALIVALTGGALAASSSSGGDEAGASAAKRGKPGKRGPKGDKGEMGDKGDKGDNGAAGQNGSPGQNGAPGKDGTIGKDGKSAEVAEIPAEELECEGRGGAEVAVEGATEGVEVCNGEEGSPWTAGGTLPPGATETGAWAFAAGDNSPEIWVPISFPIPLPEGMEGEEHVHFFDDPDFATHCTGVVGEPSAPPGELCVYYSSFGGTPVNAEFEFISVLVSPSPGASESGAVLHFKFTGAAGETANGAGSWALTGCSPSLPVGDPNKCP